MSVKNVSRCLTIRQYWRVSTVLAVVKVISIVNGRYIIILALLLPFVLCPPSKWRLFRKQPWLLCVWWSFCVKIGENLVQTVPNITCATSFLASPCFALLLSSSLWHPHKLSFLAHYFENKAYITLLVASDALFPLASGRRVSTWKRPIRLYTCKQHYVSTHSWLYFFLHLNYINCAPSKISRFPENNW